MIRQIAEYGKFAYFIIYEIKLLKLYKTCNIIKKRFITTQKVHIFTKSRSFEKNFSFYNFLSFYFDFPYVICYFVAIISENADVPVETG